MQISLTKRRNQTNELIQALAKKCGTPAEIKKAELILLSVMHGWRNNLSIDTAIIVLTNLPPFLKEIFVLDWKPSLNGSDNKSIDEILKSISHIYGLHSFPPLSMEEAYAYYMMINQLLENYIPEADFVNIRTFLPSIQKKYSFENAA
jgi:uncharacterized protein (DUF2267 family)